MMIKLPLMVVLTAVRLGAVPPRSAAATSGAASSSGADINADASNPVVPVCPANPDDRTSKTAEAMAAELEPVLARLRQAYHAAPEASPLELVKASLAALKHRPKDGFTRSKAPPTPPPLIRLDPQPHAGPKSRLWTPFLVQALFLGASALGLLTRRKVTQTTLGEDARGLTSGSRERRERAAREARQEADDRVDQVQALNLLVAALAHPEGAFAPESRTAPQEEAELSPRARWYRELAETQTLAGLVQRVERERLPYDGHTILASLSAVRDFHPPADSAAVEAQQTVGRWAWSAYRGLHAPTRTESPATSSSGSVRGPSATIDESILRHFLDLLYPSFEAAERHFFPKVQRRTCPAPATDRQIFNGITEQVLAEGAAPSRAMLRALAETAWRARRVDILGRIALSRTGDDVAERASLKLFASSRALQLLAMDAQRRRQAELVLPWAAAFVEAVEATCGGEAGSNAPSDPAEVEAGLRCLTRERAFAVNRPLEPFVVDATLCLLRSPSAADVLRQTEVVSSVLRHCVRSRHPRRAAQVFEAIPRELVSLEHYRPLLSSSHAPLARRAWLLLVARSSSKPDQAATRAALAAAAKSPEPVPLSFAFRLFRRLDRRTTRDWNVLLRLVVRYGSDRVVQRVVKQMTASGIEPDRGTAVALVGREMLRCDVQRRTLAATRYDDRAGSGTRPRGVAEHPRRVSGAAQIRKVRQTAREWDRKLSIGASQTEPAASQLDILPNLLLKNATRWTREYDVRKLVVVVRSHLGVELEAATPPGGPASIVADRPRRQPSSQGETSPAQSPWTQFAQVRRPAFRTLAKAFEQRGRADLAGKLRLALRQETELVERADRRFRRARKQGPAYL